MKQKNEFRLAMSPLTKTVFAGRIEQKDGYAQAVGVRHDVTADFYGVLIQIAESHGGKFSINENGKPAYRVTLQKLEGEA